MRVKLFTCFCLSNLETEVNTWIENNQVKVIDLKFSGSVGGEDYSASICLLYESVSEETL